MSFSMEKTKFIQYSKSFLVNSIAQIAAHLYDMGDVHDLEVYKHSWEDLVKDELGQDLVVRLI